MNKLKYIAIFVSGAAFGSFATWKYVKTKYERIAQDEIDSVKEMFSKEHKLLKSVAKENDELREKAVNLEEIKHKAEAAKEKPNIMEYAKKLTEEGYTDYSKVKEDSEKKPVEEEDNEDEDLQFMRPDLPPDEDGLWMPKEKPYIIKPESFGEEPGYDFMDLSYYADGVLTYDNNIPVENVEDLVPKDFADHFGEYEDDSVFVRNEVNRCDYEILLDLRPYSEIKKFIPPQDMEE